MVSESRLLMRHGCKLRSHSCIRVASAVASFVVITCRYVWVLGFAVAPLPSPTNRMFTQSALAPPPGSQYSTSPSASPSVGGFGFPSAGFVAPTALLLLVVAQSQAEVPRGVLATPKGNASWPRGSHTALRQAVVSMAPAVDMRQLRAKRSASWCSMAAAFFLWYAANVCFNVVNKQALGMFPHAWTVSVIQLAVVVSSSAIGWATGLIPPPLSAMGHGFLWRLLPAAFCHALGNGLTSVAFSMGAVSFTQVVKTSEPVWMALGNFLMTGARLPLSQCLALIPIMLGVALASAGELSFTWIGFVAALGSTLFFASRGILSKRLMSGSTTEQQMSPLNVYALDSLLALAFTVPVAVVADGPAIAAGTLWPSLAAHRTHLACLLGATGLSYYAYNAIAFKLLAKLDVVSHAVVNLGKRIFVIGFTVIAFNTPMSLPAATGAIVAIAGSGLYSYVKATSGTKEKQ